MRIAVWVASLALAGCGSQAQVSDNAGEAVAEAERANSRISDLEAEIESLRSDIEDEAATRASNEEAERLAREADIARVEYEIAEVETRLPY